VTARERELHKRLVELAATPEFAGIAFVLVTEDMGAAEDEGQNVTTNLRTKEMAISSLGDAIGALANPSVRSQDVEVKQRPLAPVLSIVPTPPVAQGDA
jgi:hypothetical protein